MIDQSDAPIERITTGLTYHYLDNGDIVEFILDDLSPRLVDLWIIRIKAECITKPDGGYFLLHDVSSCKVNRLPDFVAEKFRMLSNEFNQMPGYEAGYNAIIMPSNFITQILHLFLKTLPTSERGVKLFFNRDEAIVWLRQKVNDYRLAINASQ